MSFYSSSFSTRLRGWASTGSALASTALGWPPNAGPKSAPRAAVATFPRVIGRSPDARRSQAVRMERLAPPAATSPGEDGGIRGEGPRPGRSCLIRR
jgi:hypothetical protein